MRTEGTNQNKAQSASTRDPVAEFGALMLLKGSVLHTPRHYASLECYSHEIREARLMPTRTEPEIKVTTDAKGECP